jgi:hypothetical protein
MGSIATVGMTAKPVARVVILRGAIQMNSKYTPGPWKVRPYLTPDKDDDPQGVYIVSPVADKLERAYSLAEPESDELASVHAENLANAHLIAASPELVEALEEINSWAEAYGGLPEIRLIARKALNKARGGK